MALLVEQWEMDCLCQQSRGWCAGADYFSYSDRNGRTRKAFVMPQEDPSFYESCTLTYNVPELIIESVPLSPPRLGRAVATQAPLSAPSLVRK